MKTYEKQVVYKQKYQKKKENFSMSKGEKTKPFWKYLSASNSLSFTLIPNNSYAHNIQNTRKPTESLCVSGSQLEYYTNSVKQSYNIY